MPRKAKEKKELSPEEIEELESKKIAKENKKKINIQKLINSKDGQIDEDLFRELKSEMLSEGWIELDPDFNLLNVGDYVRYTIINDKKKYLFRTGGWIIKIDESKEWLVYRGHTKMNWSLNSKNVVDLFVNRKKQKE